MSAVNINSREILQRALLRLKKSNPLVSIRSLALHLDLSPSYLSKVFRGERPLNAQLLGGLTKVLQLDHHEIADIQRDLLVKFDEGQLAAQTGIRTLAPEGASSTSDYVALGKADFWLLHHWYLLPLLNLVTTDNFESSSAWIAKRLGLSEKEAAVAVDRLVESGYLDRAADGSITRSQQKIRFPTQRSHAAVRKHHERMNLKGLEVLRKSASDEEFAERLISGLAFACDPSKLGEARIIIEEALYKAANLLASGHCTEVYQINLQLFKLTKDE